MLCYLDNLLQISDRKMPFLGQFDKFWVCHNEQIDNYPISKIGVLSAVSCNASLKAITTFDTVSTDTYIDILFH